MWRRTLLLGQLLGTLAILALIPTNLGKLFALIVWWGLTFRRVSLAEATLFLAACVFFSIMNVLSLGQSIFAFSHPDVLGMPIYELFMWGFYLLHTIRLINGPASSDRGKITWGLALLYALAFAVSPNGTVLLMVTGVLLVTGLALYHEPLDLTYVGYMIALGAAVEYTGVFAGEWYYPNAPPGGVPLWFITLWGGVGLFLRRLIVPFMTRYRSTVETPS